MAIIGSFDPVLEVPILVKPSQIEWTLASGRNVAIEQIWVIIDEV